MRRLFERNIFPFGIKGAPRLGDVDRAELTMLKVRTSGVVQMLQTMQMSRGSWAAHGDPLILDRLTYFKVMSCTCGDLGRFRGDALEIRHSLSGSVWTLISTPFCSVSTQLCPHVPEERRYR